MKLINPNYANTKLSTRDGEVACDARGVAEVSDAVGQFLINTPGWTLAPGERAARIELSAREVATAPPAAPIATVDVLPPPPPPPVAPGAAEEDAVPPAIDPANVHSHADLDLPTEVLEKKGRRPKTS